MISEYRGRESQRRLKTQRIRRHKRRLVEESISVKGATKGPAVEDGGGDEKVEDEDEDEDETSLQHLRKRKGVVCYLCGCTCARFVVFCLTFRINDGL